MKEKISDGLDLARDVLLTILFLPLSIPIIFCWALTAQRYEKKPREYFKGPFLCSICKTELYCHIRMPDLPHEWESTTLVCFNPDCANFEKGILYVIDPNTGQRHGGMDPNRPFMIRRKDVTIRKETNKK